MMKPVAAEAKMNRAEEAQPKSGHAKLAASKSGSEVGNEKHTSVASAQTTGPMAGHGGLSGAVAELHEQHPIPYHDHGPHHGHTHHIRHEPLHGMKPSR